MCNKPCCGMVINRKFALGIADPVTDKRAIELLRHKSRSHAGMPYFNRPSRSSTSRAPSSLSIAKSRGTRPPNSGCGSERKRLAAVSDKANQPAYIHCGGGGRAASMWMIKRVLKDGWTIDRAAEEANLIAMLNPTLKTFATNYINAHK